jgi:hypothetical protein
MSDTDSIARLGRAVAVTLIQTLPNQKSLSAARSRIICLISGSAARSRLL